ncbi:plastocyanin/azurin family copper-binding protein [Halovivax limisalsi]|uniref:plastocyanin/azurin family copper-binding protein n=1 Tax=Halovivax limisalsi TaxID=1453760 RepID=UPI001FFD365C|nr:plastocyanin/azurin family copper-binding protein [Halovivax limisalsi]
MPPYRLTRRELLGASAGVASFALAGCLGRDEDPTATGTGELGSPTDRITVTTTSRPFPEFDPQIVHLAVGGTVEWFVETGRHDVTAYHRDVHPPHRTSEGVDPWGSDRLTGGGATFEHTFEREGIYDYVDTQQVCTSHEVAGNIGRVVVGWPDPDAEPAMADPPESMPDRAARALRMFNEESRPVLESPPD